MIVLNYRCAILFLSCQFFLYFIDVGAEISVSELVSSLSGERYDIESDPSSSFGKGNDFAPSLVPGTDIPSSVPESYVPVPTTLYPTDSEAPTSEIVRITMRGLQENSTIQPSPQDTIAPTLSLSPSNSFTDVNTPKSLQTGEDITRSPTLSNSPTVAYPTEEPITLSPVLTTTPTDSLTPTTSHDNSLYDETFDGEPPAETFFDSDNRIFVDSDTESAKERHLDENTKERQKEYHSLEIEVQYDDRPEDITWYLMKHPNRLEIQTNGKTIKAKSKTTYKIDGLKPGKYFFRIIDTRLDGLGDFKIFDTSGGGYQMIYNCAEKFGWFDYKEFYLGKKRNFYMYENSMVEQEVFAKTDRFYTLESVPKINAY